MNEPRRRADRILLQFKTFERFQAVYDAATACGEDVGQAGLCEVLNEISDRLVAESNKAKDALYQVHFLD